MQALDVRRCQLLQPSTAWPSQLLRYPSSSSSRTSSNSRVAAASASAQQLLTCRRCRQPFAADANSRDACRYHPALFTGGEVAKAIGFVRASDAPEHQLEAVVGRKGLMRFWDCCGREDLGAPGCCSAFHVSFDDELNETHGWR